MSSGARAAARHSVPRDDGLGIICTYLVQKPFHYGKHALGHDFVAIGGEVHTIACAYLSWPVLPLGPHVSDCVLNFVPEN